MATWDEVREIALALPHTSESIARGTPSWTVDKKSFAWDRPLRKVDRAALGDRAPDGPVLGVYVGSNADKEALVLGEPELFFTTSHFDGYAIVLIELDRIGVEQLREMLTDAWIARAPKRLAEEFLAEHGWEADDTHP